MRSGLSVDPAPAHAGLEILDRRLNAPDRAPVAVALSGGGDSMALLHVAKRWSERAGRPLVALTVDHGLQREGAAWSRFAAERAARLGVACQVLTWTGEKPTGGLPAAARAARHRLLAEAARTLGARVILMGHTADDGLEAEEMRRQGANVPSPRLWTPSPAWPEGRGVFLLRPLLGCRRAELRGFLAGLGEPWIEDPANDDPRFGRAAARRRLGEQPPRPLSSVPQPWSCAGLSAVTGGEAGELVAPRASFSASEGLRLLGALVVCASGAVRPPSRASLDRLRERLAGPDPFVATLAGARIEAGADSVLFCREAGERRRGGIAEAELPTGESVFDGRFVVAVREPGLRIAALAGRARRLPKREREALARIPAAARGALAAAIRPDGTLFCPSLNQDGSAPARALTLGRLRAALGAIADEESLWRVAKTPAGA